VDVGMGTLVVDGFSGVLGRLVVVAVGLLI
jgi:hypothetical protein